MPSRLFGAALVLAVACGAPAPDAHPPADPPQPAAPAAADPPAQPLTESDAPPSGYDPPPGVEERLLAMPSLELFSVDPGHRHDDGFRGYGVLGSVTRVQDGLPADGALARCLGDGLERLKFSADKRPGDTRVTQTIEFRRD